MKLGLFGKKSEENNNSEKLNNQVVGNSNMNSTPVNGGANDNPGITSQQVATNMPVTTNVSGPNTVAAAPLNNQVSPQQNPQVPNTVPAATSPNGQVMNNSEQTTNGSIAPANSNTDTTPAKTEEAKTEHTMMTTTIDGSVGGLKVHNVDSDAETDESNSQLTDKKNKDGELNPDVANVKTRVRRRRRKNMVEVKLFNKFALFLIIFGIVTLIITILFLIFSNRATSNGASLKLGDVIQVKNDVNYYSLITLSAETNMELPRITTVTNSDGTTTTKVANTYDQFVRINVQIKNKKDTPSAIRGLNQFFLLDNSNRIITECLTADDLLGYQVVDALPSTMQPGEITEGYLYCKTTISYLPTLQVVAASAFQQDSSGVISNTNATHYFIHLSQTKKSK